ncbi:hypothetical protein HZA57_10000 [Candidatus Poribacteria bacterium]|nr:hypothetical protein [Candidatus Poribacteria bacterium]
MFSCLRTSFLAGLACLASAALADPVVNVTAEVDSGSPPESAGTPVAEEAVEPENFVLRLPLIDLFGYHTDDSDYVDFSVLDAPLLRLYEEGPGGRKENVYVDIPLFRLMTVRAKGEESQHAEFLSVPGVTMFETNAAQEGTAKEVAIADLTIASLFKSESYESGSSWEVLDLPLITTLRSTSTGEDAGTFEFLHLPLVKTIEHDYADGDAHTTVAKIPFFGLFEKETADGDSHSHLLNLNFFGGDLFNLVRSDSEGGEVSTEILDLPLTATLFRATGTDGSRETTLLGLPLGTALLHTERAGEDSSGFQFLKLPLLGSAFGHRVDSERSEWKLLYLISWGGNR